MKTLCVIVMVKKGVKYYRTPISTFEPYLFAAERVSRQTATEVVRCFQTGSKLDYHVEEYTFDGKLVPPV
jgi:hypothetical protein